MAEIAPIPLAQLTTLRVGAAPLRMAEARTRDELIETLRGVWAEDDEWFVLGGGSNLLVSDEPFEGTVVLIRTSGIERLDSPAEGRARLRVQAGHEWDDLVAYTVAQGLAGIEAMSGIPGTVGAAPIQNIGAYGQEIVETLVEVELLDEGTGEVTTVPASELGLGLRTSVLKRHYGSHPLRSAVVLSVTLDLEIVGDGGRVITSEQLRSALGVEAGERMPLAQVRSQVLAIRASKGMVLDAADPDTTSAGSFFQNPIISDAVSRTLPPECPRWPVAPASDDARVIPLAAYDGNLPPVESSAAKVKVPAAWLIEHSGAGRGFKLPGSRAGLSNKHALALTNRGGATAEEVAELARFVRSRVHAEFGLMLEPEPVLIGVEL